LQARADVANNKRAFDKCVCSLRRLINSHSAASPGACLRTMQQSTSIRLHACKFSWPWPAVQAAYLWFATPLLGLSRAGRMCKASAGGSPLHDGTGHLV
jgi:hypothetical protein